MCKSNSETAQMVKEVFPGTANETLAEEAAAEALQALRNLQKRLRGHTLTRSQLNHEMVQVLKEAFMAYERLIEKQGKR